MSPYLLLPVLCVLTCFPSGVVPLTGSDQLPNASMDFAEAAHIATQQDSLMEWLSRRCRDGYYDLRNVSWLELSRDRRVTSREHPYGTGRELQCEDSPMCAVYEVNDATCLNSGFTGRSISWRCSAFIRSPDYSLANMRLLCEEQDKFDNFCVLKGSCMLVYSLRSGPSVNFGARKYLTVLTICAAIILIFGCVYHGRRPNLIPVGRSLIGSNYAFPTASTTIPNTTVNHQGAAPPYNQVVLPSETKSPAYPPPEYTAPADSPIPTATSGPSYNEGFVPSTPPPPYSTSNRRA